LYEKKKKKVPGKKNKKNKKNNRSIFSLCNNFSNKIKLYGAIE